MIGVILAGGTGKRLYPLTKNFSKQLLPVYDKPLIYYPLSTLMLAGIREIIIISSPEHIQSFKNLLSNGSDLGINISYIKQLEPKGIANGIQAAESRLKGSKFALILGDNIFYGAGLGRELMKYQNVQGAHIFGYRVSNPSSYGVVEIDENNNIISIEEKPKVPRSNFAITGLYFYDEFAIEYSKNLKPSNRGEFEITDLNKIYFDIGNLHCRILPRGTAWLDTGTFQGLHDASTFVRITEERTGLRIGDPTEAAKVQGWIF